MAKECDHCYGYGHLESPGGFGDCRVCNGTGYADKIARMSCIECRGVFKESDMRVSPDEDGNRTVCRFCNDNC